MIAHIVSGLPLAVQWSLALLIFGGGLLVFAVRSSALRIAGGVAAVGGAAALIASWVLSPALIVAAPYPVRIVSPAPGAVVGAPLTLTVCGVRSPGHLVPATSAQYYLAVIVDGVQAPTVDTWQIPLDLSSGRHTIEVELVSPSHQAFVPPATFTETVTVVPGATTPGPGSC
ncbi:MAG: hypothetical protein ACHQ4F_03020 [Candidatus Dormibacteria bacterium]